MVFTIASGKTRCQRSPSLDLGGWQEARDRVYCGERRRSLHVAALSFPVLVSLTLELVILQIRFKRTQGVNRLQGHEFFPCRH